ncbi:MAG: hypothetical protein HY941_12195 [Gammaproteobacteria bacterium]|nr:hypothetical protein [Gammaproteobacteria bacterium]
MNRPLDYSMRIVSLATLLLLAGFAHAASNAAQTETTGESPWLPARVFCEQRGGTITETGNEDVYICCYKQKQKCLVSNTRSKQSFLVDLPWKTTGLEGMD